VDARLHHVQGKAGVRETLVHRDDLRQLLTDCAAERLAILQRHEAGARVVSHYDLNNTYQYVIAREETHVSWLQNALAEFGAVLPAPGAALSVPDAPKPGKNVTTDTFRSILEDDARTLGGFVERWRGRVEAMTHARHRTMLNVILGESLEHKRLFEQGAAGFEDLLGRRTDGAERVGGVLSTRWME
jgi:hypothetical protein